MRLRRALLVLGLAGLISFSGAGLGPAQAAGSHASSASTRAVAPPQPGEGWLTGRRQRLLAVWLLVDVGGLMLWFGAEPARAPRLLGSVGAHRSAPRDEDSDELPVRGIGRFARPRTEPPHRIQ